MPSAANEDTRYEFATKKDAAKKLGISEAELHARIEKGEFFLVKKGKTELVAIPVGSDHESDNWAQKLLGRTFKPGGGLDFYGLINRFRKF